MSSVSRWLWGPIVVLSWIGLCASTRVAAQSCHEPALRPPEDSSWRVALASTFATYATSSYAGEYQGVRASAAYQHARFSAQLSLPYYRIVRNGLTEHGFGDVGADLRVVAFETDDRALSAGPEFALTAPSGDAKDDLGMGHFMLMPGAWLRLRLAQATLMAQAAYGHSAGTMRGMAHRHTGVGPIVNPMNKSELEHSFTFAYSVLSRLQLAARLWGAVPVADTVGVAREALSLGVQALAGPADVSLEVQLPVAGAPFRERLVLTVGGQW